jgi:DNA end-binding protein Ku
MLRLALVSIPIRLVSAVRRDGTVAFHQIDRETKQRVRYKKTVQGGREVAKDDVVRGFEVQPGEYVLLEDDEIDALKLRTRHTLELVQFVRKGEIDPIYFDNPYYVLPDGEDAEEGYAVVRDALRESGAVGVGQLTMRGKENLVALTPAGRGMQLATLRYASELRAPQDVFGALEEGPELRSDLLDMAKELIEKKAAPFDPTRFTNHYADALRDLVREKLEKGHVVPVDENEEERGGARIVDFMEALKRSVRDSDDGGARPKSKTRSGKKGPRAA